MGKRSRLIMAEFSCCTLFLLLSIVPFLGIVGGDARLLEGLQSPPETTMTVPITDSDLALLSSSVLAAESWLRSNVLAKMPGTGVCSVLVGGGALDDGRNEQQRSVLLVSALKNVYYCLTRWSLGKDFKVSDPFFSECLQHNAPLSPGFMDCMMEKRVTRLLNSHRGFKFASYCVQAHSHPKQWTSERFSALEILGLSQARERKLVSRKLSSLSFPSLPKQPKPAVSLSPIQFAPVPETSFAFVPVHSPSELPANPPDSSTFPSPHHRVAPSKAPAFPPIPFVLPPALPVSPPSVPPELPASPPTTPPALPVSPPKVSPASPVSPPSVPPELPASSPSTPPALPVSPPSVPPELPVNPPSIPPALPVSPPSEVPINPPVRPVLSPPEPSPTVDAAAPGPGTRGEPSKGLWCVAKPTVPEDKLQEAMDYACGEGGADCHEIEPDGSCYYPDTVLAHASFAFNSYWQKAKEAGGSCNFDGTAVLISSDPSFEECHYVLN